MQRIRVLLGRMPRMLRDVISAAIRETTDMLVVGSRDGDPVDPAWLAECDADVLIVVPRDSQESATLDSLLFTRPTLTLLTLGDDGRSSTLSELRPYHLMLGNAAPAELLQAIRTSAQARVH